MPTHEVCQQHMKYCCNYAHCVQAPINPLTIPTCGQRDVDAFLQTATQSLINVPGEIGGCQNHDGLGRVIIGHTHT